ncbi:hypothetical protein QBD00_002245 [Ochrobactrum sp. AN78]|nr:hypothetical protein [Ochrobactrum sp. AN78]
MARLPLHLTGLRTSAGVQKFMRLYHTTSPEIICLISLLVFITGALETTKNGYL